MNVTNYHEMHLSMKKKLKKCIFLKGDLLKNDGI